MSTRIYLTLMTILLVAALFGSWFVLGQGETWSGVAERLVRFLPAAVVITFLWRASGRSMVAPKTGVSSDN